MDINGFVDALEDLAKSEVKRREIGVAARRYISDLASFATHGKKYISLVCEISGSVNYTEVQPHCSIENYVQPEFLKPWRLARLLPTCFKTWLRRFM